MESNFFILHRPGFILKGVNAVSLSAFDALGPFLHFQISPCTNTSKLTKLKNIVANIFRTLFEKTPLIQILRPNLWAKNDPMLILSLSAFREKV